MGHWYQLIILCVGKSAFQIKNRSKYLRRFLVSSKVSYFKPKHSGTITAEKNWIFLPHSETKNLQQCLMAALNANKRIMASHENLSRLEKKRKKENRRTAALKLQWSNSRELPNSVGVFRIS